MVLSEIFEDLAALMMLINFLIGIIMGYQSQCGQLATDTLAPLPESFNFSFVIFDFFDVSADLNDFHSRYNRNDRINS